LVGEASPGRALGIDLGAKRVGVAVTDSDRRVATPIEVVARSGDRGRDHRALAALVDEWEVTTVVVGVPYSLDGRVGPAAQGILDEIAQLRATLRVPVETYDERLSTVTAERSLMQQNLRADERRRVVDMVAASVLLQGWIDAQAATDR
jgi:putative Holliday junction resolvase